MKAFGTDVKNNLLEVVMIESITKILQNSNCVEFYDTSLSRIFICALLLLYPSYRYKHP